MKSDQAFIAHIKESAARIHNFIAGYSYQDFLADEKTVSAVVRELIVVGEAAAHLSDDFQAKHPEIPFYEISGMRNRIVHAYWDIDEAVVWKTCSLDIPALEKLLGGL